MALAGPSIKGTVFQTVVDDVKALVDRKAVSRESLEARLQAGDVRILDSKIEGARWYPMDSYGRMIELLRDVEGRADPRQYLLQRGMRAANRLIDLGLYRQIEKQAGQPLAKVGDAMITLSTNMYNFSIWSFASDPDGKTHRLEVVEAAAFPEVSRIVVEGFIDALTTRGMKIKARVSSARPAPDRILFTLVEQG
jgi:hypothetical protein